MSDQAVWYSGAANNSGLIKGFTWAAFEADKREALKVVDRILAGEPVPQDELPKQYWQNWPGESIPKLPPLSVCGSVFIASQALADVLKEFDMGAGGLYPVQMLKHSRKKPIEGTYYIIVPGTQKRAVLPEKSPKLEDLGGGRFSAGAVFHDDEIAVSSKALEGPDIWVEPQLIANFFVSDRLASALRKAKVARGFKFKRCRIVDED